MSHYLVTLNDVITMRLLTNCINIFMTTFLYLFRSTLSNRNSYNIGYM